MVLANYLNPQTPKVRILADAQCEELYQASLACLSRVGVQVNHAGACGLLAKAGARVVDRRAYIPAGLIQEVLEVTSHTFQIAGRDDRFTMQITPERVHFGPGPSCTYFIDSDTGLRRKARRGDAALTARVCDALPEIDYAMGLSLFSDVPAVFSPVYEFAEAIANTTKPVLAWAFNPANLAAIYRIAAVVAGGEAALRLRPNFAFFATYKSPLQHTQEDLANVLWAAEHGIPVIYLGGPTIGLESPVTGASGLVLHLAAALSGLAIIQLKHPGSPVVIGSVPAAMDLRTARVAYGSPEMSLYSAAAVDLARYLGLPFMGTAGASESKLLDSQAALEATLQVLMSSLSGAALVHDIGFLDCADIGSLPYLVMTDEIIAMTKRILRGLEINQDTIMLDLIQAVGPGGNFIAEYQSASLCRREIWVPTFLDRNSYTIWMEKGGQSTEERVTGKLENILYHHQPAPLPAGVPEAITSILSEMEAGQVNF